MKRTFLPTILLSVSLGSGIAIGQSGPLASPGANGAQGAPVSYASVTQLNGLLSQLETTSKATQGDLVKMRIEKWKASGADKKQALGYVDSIQRNLQGALPEMIGQLRNSPEDLPATFKLYRNLDALYDVMNIVAEAAQSFGSKDDAQAMTNDVSAFEGTRKQLAERIESLSSAKEQQITRLQEELKTARAEIPAAPPKKTVVDDTEPPKKPAAKKKSTTTKKPADATKPAAGQSTQPQSQSSKPQ